MSNPFGRTWATDGRYLMHRHSTLLSTPGFQLPRPLIATRMVSRIVLLMSQCILTKGTYLGALVSVFQPEILPQENISTISQPNPHLLD